MLGRTLPRDNAGWWEAPDWQRAQREAAARAPEPMAAAQQR
jgi:hypothetical protein